MGNGKNQHTKNLNLPLIENLTTNLMPMRVNLLGVRRHLGFFFVLIFSKSTYIFIFKGKVNRYNAFKMTSGDIKLRCPPNYLIWSSLSLIEMKRWKWRCKGNTEMGKLMRNVISWGCTVFCSCDVDIRSSRRNIKSC